MLTALKQNLLTLELSPQRRNKELLNPSSPWQATKYIPGGNLPVVIFWWGLKDVNGHGVAREVSKAKHFWAHQGVLNE